VLLRRLNGRDHGIEVQVFSTISHGKEIGTHMGAGESAKFFRLQLKHDLISGLKNSIYGIREKMSRSCSASSSGRLKMSSDWSIFWRK
jgi:hypothetical protein